jgi:DNA topoisomerase-1
MNLVIVESATKASVISKYLNRSALLSDHGKFIVIASQGHIRDICKKNMGIDLDTFECSFERIPSKKHVITKLIENIKKSSMVYLAADNDREGEGIAWHIKDMFRLKKCKRIVFNEITENAIVNAVLNPCEIHMGRVESYLSRRILDRLVGFMMTKTLWKAFDSAISLSAGRVQSATLKLLCDREDEMKEYQSNPYWTFHVVTNEINDMEFTLYYQGDVFQVSEEAIVQTLLREPLCHSKYQIREVQLNNNKQKRAPPPFITSTLQQSAHNDLGYSLKRTMCVAQELYEKGKITYMRTDSTAINTDTEQAIMKQIVNTYGNEYANHAQMGGSSSKKRKHAQEAHEAIRPTNVGLHALSSSESSTDQRKLYELIYKRTIGYYMKPARYNEIKMKLTMSELDHNYEMIGKTILLQFDGWLKLYGAQTASESGESFLKRYDLRNPVLSLCKLEGRCRWSSPPIHYSESSLVKTLEDKGIGRPSTYASIIEKLIEKHYVTKQGVSGVRKEFRHFQMDLLSRPLPQLCLVSENKTIGEENGMKLVVQEIGFVINGFVTRYYPRIADSEFTSSMESALDSIAKGDLNYKNYLEAFYRNDFEKTYDNVMHQLSMHTHTKRTNDDGGGRSSRSSGTKKPLGKDERKFRSKIIDELISGGGGHNAECIVRIARHGPVIELRHESQKSRYVNLTPYLKDTKKKLNELTEKDIVVLLKMPMSISYKNNTYDLMYGMHGFYFKGHVKKIFPQHVSSFIIEEKYQDLVKTLFKV